MSDADLEMDYAIVEAMAETFGSSKEVLKETAEKLRTVSEVLNSTALVGSIGAAAKLYIETLLQNMEKLAEICDEMKLDLHGAVSSMQDGDDQGRKRFIG